MAQYKIENKKLSIEILGVVYSISKPKFKQIVEMEDALENMTAKEKLNYIHERLVSYGIPSEVLDNLDGDSYLELIEIVHASKKNSV